MSFNPSVSNSSPFLASQARPLLQEDVELTTIRDSSSDPSQTERISTVWKQQRETVSASTTSENAYGVEGEAAYHRAGKDGSLPTPASSRSGSDADPSDIGNASDVESHDSDHVRAGGTTYAHLSTRSSSNSSVTSNSQKESLLARIMRIIKAIFLPASWIKKSPELSKASLLEHQNALDVVEETTTTTPNSWKEKCGRAVSDSAYYIANAPIASIAGAAGGITGCTFFLPNLFAEHPTTIFPAVASFTLLTIAARNLTSFTKVTEKKVAGFLKKTPLERLASANTASYYSTGLPLILNDFNQSMSLYELPKRLRAFINRPVKEKTPASIQWSLTKRATISWPITSAAIAAAAYTGSYFVPGFGGWTLSVVGDIAATTFLAPVGLWLEPRLYNLGVYALNLNSSVKRNLLITTSFASSNSVRGYFVAIGLLPIRWSPASLTNPALLPIRVVGLGLVGITAGMHSSQSSRERESLPVISITETDLEGFTSASDVEKMPTFYEKDKGWPRVRLGVAVTFVGVGTLMLLPPVQDIFKANTYVIASLTGGLSYTAYDAAHWSIENKTIQRAQSWLRKIVEMIEAYLLMLVSYFTLRNLAEDGIEISNKEDRLIYSAIATLVLSYMYYGIVRRNLSSGKSLEAHEPIDVLGTGQFSEAVAVATASDLS